MATLLEGVNDVLRKRKLIEGDAAALTTLTDPSRQLYIDTIVSSWREAVDQLYTTADEALPTEVAEGTVTLVSGTRAYDLPDDLVQIRWPLKDVTNGYTIAEYPGGYRQMWRDQLQPSNYTGRPTLGAISPVNSQLYLDMVPQDSDAGLVYTVLYDKDFTLVDKDDVFPFADIVYRAMVPIVAELVRRDLDNSYDAQWVQTNIGRASRLITKGQPRESWKQRAYMISGEDPYAD